MNHLKTRDPMLAKAYEAWSGAKSRTRNPKKKQYDDWGGRGIQVCRAFSASFDIFVATVGLPPTKDHTLDRIDNDGHYSCGGCTQCVGQGWAANCRWATREEQANNRRGNVWIEHDGRRQTVSQWAHEFDMEVHILYGRLKLGWPIEKVIATPVRKQTPFHLALDDVFDAGQILNYKPRDLPENLRDYRKRLKAYLDRRSRKRAA